MWNVEVTWIMAPEYWIWRLYGWNKLASSFDFVGLASYFWTDCFAKQFLLFKINEVHVRNCKIWKNIHFKYFICNDNEAWVRIEHTIRTNKPNSCLISDWCSVSTHHGIALSLLHSRSDCLRNACAVCPPVQNICNRMCRDGRIRTLNQLVIDTAQWKFIQIKTF